MAEPCKNSPINSKWTTSCQAQVMAPKYFFVKLGVLHIHMYMQVKPEGGVFGVEPVTHFATLIARTIFCIRMNLVQSLVLRVFEHGKYIKKCKKMGKITTITLLARRPLLQQEPSHFTMMGMSQLFVHCLFVRECLIQYEIHKSTWWLLFPVWSGFVYFVEKKKFNSS